VITGFPIDRDPELDRPAAHPRQAASHAGVDLAGGAPRHRVFIVDWLAIGGRN
jgi:hypothetical protein